MRHPIRPLAMALAVTLVAGCASNLPAVTPSATIPSTAAATPGIKVIVDLVMNHTSSESPWFKDAATPGSKHDDWYGWSDRDPGWLGPSGQVAWHPEGGRWFYGVFWEGMPDLNLRNSAVTAELEDVARFWLDDMGVDGFRLDAAKRLIEDGRDAQTNTPETKAWLAGFKQAVDAVNPDALLVGEVHDPPSIAGPYVPDSVAAERRALAAASSSASGPVHLLPPSRRRPRRAADDEPRLEPELFRG